MEIKTTNEIFKENFWNVLKDTFPDENKKKWVAVDDLIEWLNDLNNNKGYNHIELVKELELLTSNSKPELTIY